MSKSTTSTEHAAPATRSPKPETPNSKPEPESTANGATPTHPGRPTLYTEATIERLCAHIREHGLSDSPAAVRAGVSVASISRWKRAHPGLAPRLAGAREEFRAAMLSIILTATTRDGRPDWRAAAWILERVFPEDYSRTRGFNPSRYPAPGDNDNDNFDFEGALNPLSTESEVANYDRQTTEEYERLLRTLAKKPAPKPIPPIPPKSPTASSEPAFQNLQNPPPPPKQPAPKPLVTTIIPPPPIKPPRGQDLWLHTTGAALGNPPCYPSQSPEDDFRDRLSP